MPSPQLSRSVSPPYHQVASRRPERRDHLRPTTAPRLSCFQSRPGVAAQRARMVRFDFHCRYSCIAMESRFAQAARDALTGTGHVLRHSRCAAHDSSVSMHAPSGVIQEYRLGLNEAGWVFTGTTPRRCGYENARRTSRSAARRPLKLTGSNEPDKPLATSTPPASPCAPSPPARATPAPAASAPS